jgi:hypothetical protein
MSNTFKYLDANQAYTSKDDAAQSFLNEKLSKNRYTIQQQESLDANGGPAVVNASEGVIPVSSESSNPKSTITDATPTATSTWDGENYSQGAFNADDLKKHFGLEDGSDVGAGYNADRGATDDDQTKDNDLLSAGYLSNKNYDRLASDDKVKKAYAAINGQAAADKKFKDGSISINTLDALFDDLTARANTAEPTPEPKKKPAPIEHSPEIKQAIDLAKSYEGNILSGKTSEDIYGSGSDYSFDAAKGAAGIGTPMNGDSGQQASKATASFLDKKLFDVKAKQQFQPTS